MTSDVKISFRADNVLDIGLNRPQSGNALTPEMAETIAEALRGLSAEARAVLLRAEGSDFCTGRSAVMPAAGTRATALDLRRLISDPVLDFYALLRELPVPLVIAVRGRASGVGCALAGLADVAIAADTALFSIPEMNHDIAPTLVMAALADRLPRAALARLVLTRDAVSAAEAKALGLIGVVAPEAGLDSEVERVVGQLAKNSPPVVRGIKAFLTTSPEMSFTSRREHAALINATVTAERYR